MKLTDKEHTFLLSLVANMQLALSISNCFV